MNLSWECRRKPFSKATSKEKCGMWVDMIKDLDPLMLVKVEKYSNRRIWITIGKNVFSASTWKDAHQILRAYMDAVDTFGKKKGD